MVLFLLLFLAAAVVTGIAIFEDRTEPRFLHAAFLAAITGFIASLISLMARASRALFGGATWAGARRPGNARGSSTKPPEKSPIVVTRAGIDLTRERAEAAPQRPAGEPQTGEDSPGQC